MYVFLRICNNLMNQYTYRQNFFCIKKRDFSISKYIPLSRINMAFLVVSFYKFNTFIRDFSFYRLFTQNKGATIRGHQITADTIPAHNFGINKFLHPYLITKFYIHFSLLKTQVHIYQKSPEPRLNWGFT